MSKGKEAMAAKIAENKKLQQIITDQYKEITRLRQIEKSLNSQVLQLKTYQDRMSELNDFIRKIETLEKESIENERLVDMWTYRAIILAKADYELDESMFSAESLAVLTDMNMLPKSILTNRTARRNAKSGSSIKKHMNSIDSVLKEVKSQGVRGILNV
jgi:hypothetical protein